MTSSNNGGGAASAAPAIVIPEDATLAQIDRMARDAQDAIDAVRTPEEAEQLLGQVTVAEHAVRVAKVSGEHEQRWGRLRLLAERRYGELLGPPGKGGRPPGKTVTAGNSSSGAERKAQNQARKVAAVPQAVFDEYVEKEPKPTRSGLLRNEPKPPPKRTKKTGRDTSPDAAAERLRQRLRYVRSSPLAHDKRPRWTLEDMEDVEIILKHPPKRRAKYAGKRLRELASKRHVGPEPRLAMLQYRMVQAVSLLESTDVADYDLADPDDASAFYDELLVLAEWTDRSIALAASRLGDVALEQKIAKLRDGTGRTEAERRTALAMADKLERRRLHQLA